MTEPAAVAPLPLLTASQVAQYLQVPVATIHQWRSRKEGPRATKVGRHLRFRPADVADWLEQQADPLPAPATIGEV